MKDQDFTAVWALTIDQQRSRRQADRVPRALELAAALGGGVLLGAERTAGDEVQLLLAEPTAVVHLVEGLTRDGGWWIGIGLGAVDTPLPASTREARGPAYLAARAAVERAHASPTALALETSVPDGPHSGEPKIVGGSPYGGTVTIENTPHTGADALARQAEAALWLQQGLLQHRSREGWQVVDLLEAGMTVRQAAERLGISPSAASQRHQRAGWEQARRGRELCGYLLDALQQAGRAGVQPC